MRAILTGLTRGELHSYFIEGMLILLAKRGDLRFFINKRPLTLLNVIYKIIAKAYQLKLSIILQRFISDQQSAFVPSRSIHHSLLLTNELLHAAINDEEDCLLLKLNVIKAFN